MKNFDKIKQNFWLWSEILFDLIKISFLRYKPFYLFN